MALENLEDIINENIKTEVKFVLASGTKEEFQAKLEDEENPEFASTYKDGAIVFIKESNVIYCNGVYYNEFILPITCEKLRTLKDEAKLIPGLKYRITDYTCDVNAKSTDIFKSAGHAFDIVVTALASNELASNAFALLHEPGEDEDPDDYFALCNLSLWEIKYELAEGYSCGLITYMKDEYGNEAPYDFKNILFKRYQTLDTIGHTPPYIGFYATSENDPIYKGSTALVTGVTVDATTYKWFYTFVGDLATLELDGSVTGNAKYNVCKNITYLSNVVMAGSYNTIINSYNVTIVGHDNKINASTNIVLMEGNYNNINACSTLLWSTKCHENTLINCNNVSFGSNSYQNVIKNVTAVSSSKISFGTNCFCNTIENNSALTITFGSESYYNKVLNCTAPISLYGYAKYNIFKLCSNIKTTSAYLWFNTFKECSSLTISSYCLHNIFNIVTNSNIGAYMLSNNLYNCSYLTFQGASATAYIYNSTFNSCTYLTLSYISRSTFGSCKYLKKNPSTEYHYYLDGRNAGDGYSTSNYIILDDIVEPNIKYTLRIIAGYPPIVQTDVPSNMEIEYIE